MGTIVLLGGADAIGVEVETALKPTTHWILEVRGTYEDGRYRGFGSNTGNRVVRQPRLQFAASPSYTTQIGNLGVKVHFAYTYVGDRYSDVENLQRLPAYSTIDAGLHATLKNGIYLDLVAENLGNTFGLTEGNTRLLGAALSSGTIIARPLFGRNVNISLGYQF